MNNAVKVGLLGIGLNTYWDQFPGLKIRLEEYLSTIKQKLKREDVEIVSGGIIDNPLSARRIGETFREERVEMIFLCISTYALSHTVLPIAQETNVPIVILSLQPVPAIDYNFFNSMDDRGMMTGEWLAHCQTCALPEIVNVFKRAKVAYYIVSGYLEEDFVWKEIHEWLDAIVVRVQLKKSRVGILGHYYGGMMDVYSDITLLASVFGVHFEILEMCELQSYRNNITSKDIEQKISEFQKKFVVAPDCDEYELNRAAKTSCALDQLVRNNDLNALAYYYEGMNGNEYEDIVTSVIAGNTLLTANSIPVAGECEIKNVLAMKILDLFGTGGSFSEIYAVDYRDDIIIWGHDGPAHPQIAEGDVKLVPLPVYHGKPGKGLSIQMNVQVGHVTFLAVIQGGDAKTFLLVAEGDSVPGPILHIGNTNSRYRFSIHARDFINKWSEAGPSHHCAIGVGHIAGKIEKISELLGVECIRVC